MSSRFTLVLAFALAACPRVHPQSEHLHAPPPPVPDAAPPAFAAPLADAAPGAVVDTDGDGIPDGRDNCPQVANPDQIDRDGDHWGDACDGDRDGDGIANEKDDCPDVYDPQQADQDRDHLGDVCDPDLDGDSVANEYDNCPLVANKNQKDGNDDGIGDACTAVCGNKKVEAGEDCEPKVSPTQSCAAVGMGGANASCVACHWDFSQCQPIRRGGRGSCPYVYLWDGSAYHFYGDLSGSVLGKGLDIFKPAYYGENIYELGDYAPSAGRYRMRLREVIYEASFVDALALVLVDVPAGYSALNEWSFTSELEREPGRRFLTVHDPRPPLTATTEAGRDVRAEVAAADGVPLPVAEDELSRVILDFGPIAHPEHAKLVVTAWGGYLDLRGRQAAPFSAGTTIETEDAAGHWQVRMVAGKAAGDDRTWVVDIGGLVTRDNTRMRVTMAHLPSVLDVLDAVALDDSEPVPVTVTRVQPELAALSFGGATQVDGSTLAHRVLASDERLPLLPDALLAGHYTRYGDVLPLLGAADDRFVLMAHGDELALSFAAPAQAAGTTRRAFLSADVMYTLKYHPFGQLTDTNEPIPYHGMKTYPYAPEDWPHRGDPDYAAYQKEWNTRVIAPAP